MFKAHDVYGIVGGVLLLIFVYLILQNGGWPFSAIVNATGSASNNLIRSLQGR